MRKKDLSTHEDKLLFERLKKHNEALRKPTYDEIKAKRDPRNRTYYAKQKLKKAQEPFSDKPMKQTELAGF
jgi:hypothetical protein